MEKIKTKTRIWTYCSPEIKRKKYNFEIESHNQEDCEKYSTYHWQANKPENKLYIN